ncbi:MAG: hypothetical protein O6831_07260 [Alphaproteobacteria bacterium]|nr:hypothetical protein [Alphaproteobacteria bacterium]
MRSEPNIDLSPTKDCPVIVQLNDRWRVVNDDLQWIVECQQGNKWRKLHFVATKKAVLERIFHEEGISLSTFATASSRAPGETSE